MNILAEERAKLLGSFLLFTQVFYKLRTGRDFEISEPIGRESHHITIAKELTKTFNLETKTLMINVPPGHGKSELLIHFVAWAFAHYPDCQFIYISYSHELAAAHTLTIKQIMELPQYKAMFGIEISKDSSARDNFKTTKGGAVKAFGSSGSITGMNAGLPNCDRFSGCVIMDDMHKPDEVHSDTMRDAVIRNYNQTIKPRPRGPNVPLIFIGQRLHEGDLPQFLIDRKDGFTWKRIILKAIDDAGNILYPKVNPLEMLTREKEFNPYVYSAQYQQDPQPEGGGIFKRDKFLLLDEEPEILSTFCTVDTAETSKAVNDATVFSFWGLHKILIRKVDTGLFGLLWINCIEGRFEPSDLENEFMNFYANSMRHKVKPQMVAIEKKSTGVTLLSVLKKCPGLNVIGIERTKASGNKTARYVEMQP